MHLQLKEQGWDHHILSDMIKIRLTYCCSKSRRHQGIIKFLNLHRKQIEASV